MGEINKPYYVKLIVGFLWSDDNLLHKCQQKMEDHFGEIDFESSAIDFTFTKYYNSEIGDNIKRKYVSFKKLISPEDLPNIKVYTNDIEQVYAKENKRPVNIDPGYVDLSKLVLASTKDATYRIYAQAGMYLQSTLYFEGKTFKPWPLTYADYRSDHAVEFFNKVRTNYKQNEYRSKKCQTKRVGYTSIYYKPWFIGLITFFLLFPLTIIPIRKSLAFSNTGKLFTYVFGILWSAIIYYYIIVFCIKFGDAAIRLFHTINSMS